MDYTLQDALQEFEAEAWTASKRTITTQALISLKELVQRWTGATEQEIITEERTGRLVAFYKEKTIINPETLVREHWLSPGQLPTFFDFEEERLDLSSDCLFLKNNILEIEKERPDFLYMRDDDENRGNDCIDSPQCASEKRQCFWQEPTEEQKTLRETEAQPAAKTAPASAAKQENALAAWKPVIPAMLEVYHQCLAEGPTQRTKKDLERLFTRQGVELTQAQMAFFRDCLPEGHVNKTGGAPLQKS